MGHICCKPIASEATVISEADFNLAPRTLMYLRRTGNNEDSLQESTAHHYFQSLSSRSQVLDEVQSQH
jgi:hypothetical protein